MLSDGSAADRGVIHSASSALLEIDNRSRSSCSEDSDSEDDESGTDDEYACQNISVGCGGGVNGQHQS